MSRLAREIASCAFVALACACSKSPSEKDIVDSMTSWIGTADMASQAWLNHTTFDRYTRETLELSAKMLDEQEQQRSDLSALSSGTHASPALDSAVKRASRSMTMIAGLIAANDAPGVQVQLDSLRAAKKIVLAESDTIARHQR